MKLDFVVPGFSKCGTTTLCTLLGQHPEIDSAVGSKSDHFSFAAAKEPGFFAESHHLGWEWYERRFDAAEPGTLTWDGSTTYSSREYADVASERMSTRFPDLKYVFIARHPIARLESSYREMHDSGYKYGLVPPMSIGGTLREFPNLLADSKYWELINVYRRRVPDDRIHVLLLEELQQDQTAAVRGCFEFLGVDPDVDLPTRPLRLNSRASKRYETAPLRWLRHKPWFSRTFGRLPQGRQQAITEMLGLRRPFRGPVQWDVEAKAAVREALADDSAEFLRYCGRAPEIWKWPVTTSLPRAA